jgi:creatinine amidohydrolase
LTIWAELTADEVGAAVAAAGVGLVPVGAVEQHGPHLPTGTDTILATALCEAAAEATGALVLPAIGVGVSYGHGTVLPGTLSLAPEQLATTVRQWAEWAATSGLTRLLFVNAHAGNEAALGIGTDHLRLFRPDLRVGFVTWWNLSDDLRRDMLADGPDAHANRAETSLMLAIAPGLVRTERLRDADDDDRTGGLVFRYTAASLSLTGVTGHPSESSAGQGEDLRARIVAALTDLVGRARTEQPPLGSAKPPDLRRSTQ